MPIRLKLLSFVFFVFFAGLVTKLFYWQIIRAKDLKVQARYQYKSESAVAAPRGNILAADGSLLAAKTDAWLIFASIPELKRPNKDIANLLAPLFVDDPSIKDDVLAEVDRLVNLISKKEVVWIPLKQRVTNEVKNTIENLKIEGIGFEKQEARFYPEASSAAQLLGFVGKDLEGQDQGYFGLEGYYNLPLSGKPGFLAHEKDARGTAIVTDKAKEVSAIGGVDLFTHIDKSVQLMLERRLKDAIEKYGARGGTAIIMNPENGAILGMASFPSFDPSKYWEWSDEYFKNPAISFTFEPGSIFKVLIMASALDAGVVSPDTKCDICDGPVSVDKYKIETWNNKYFPDSTITDVIIHSDNVGMIFVGQKLGAEALYDYLDKFAIGKPTAIDLQGEVSPQLRPKKTWNIVDLATASFGQGVAITPIQMIKAVAAIANAGVLVTPQVVGKLVGDAWENDVKPVVGERVISEKAAREMTGMMVEAAEKGESKWARIPGFKVAAKTGTAQIPIAGHYDKEKTIASFIGFAPAYNPKFIMLLTLQEPKTSPWASETAAPAWYSIARDLFPYFGIQPED